MCVLSFGHKEEVEAQKGTEEEEIAYNEQNKHTQTIKKNICSIVEVKDQLWFTATWMPLKPKHSVFVKDCQ